MSAYVIVKFQVDLMDLRSFCTFSEDLIKMIYGDTKNYTLGYGTGLNLRPFSLYSSTTCLKDDVA